MKVIINKILYIKLWSTAIVSNTILWLHQFLRQYFLFLQHNHYEDHNHKSELDFKIAAYSCKLCTIFLLHHPIATEIQAVIQFNPLLWEYNCWTSSSLFYYARTATKDRKIMQPNSLTGLGPLSPAFNNLLELIKELPGLLHRCSAFNFLWALKKI